MINRRTFLTISGLYVLSKALPPLNLFASNGSDFEHVEAYDGVLVLKDKNPIPIASNFNIDVKYKISDKDKDNRIDNVSIDCAIENDRGTNRHFRSSLEGDIISGNYRISNVTNQGLMGDIPFFTGLFNTYFKMEYIPALEKRVNKNLKFFNQKYQEIDRN